MEEMMSSGVVVGVNAMRYRNSLQACRPGLNDSDNNNSAGG